jgi:hypothetical protein
MGFLTNLIGFAGGLPWAKIGLFAALTAAIVSGIYGIKAYGGQAEIIKQQKADAQVQHDQYERTISDLQEKNKRDLASVQKEKDNALKIAVNAQTQLDRIKASPASSDGPIRPVLADTLAWMRGTNSGSGNQNGKAAPAH